MKSFVKISAFFPSLKIVFQLIECFSKRERAKDNHRSQEYPPSQPTLTTPLVVRRAFSGGKMVSIACCKSFLSFRSRTKQNSKLKFLPIFQLAQQKPKTKRKKLRTVNLGQIVQSWLRMKFC